MYTVDPQLSHDKQLHLLVVILLLCRVWVQIPPMTKLFFHFINLFGAYFFIPSSITGTITVTRSAKTRHNSASLNFQYKALNTMGEILVYY